MRRGLSQATLRYLVGLGVNPQALFRKHSNHTHSLCTINAFKSIFKGIYLSTNLKRPVQCGVEVILFLLDTSESTASFSILLAALFVCVFGCQFLGVQTNLSPHITLANTGFARCTRTSRVGWYFARCVN